MSSDNLVQCDGLIIGGGVIGLSVANRLQNKLEMVLVEARKQFGQETSSRNSEVIHSGIYYPKESQKTKLCISGRQKLYDFCKVHQIAHKKLGKYVVATSEADEQYLTKLASHCKDVDVACEYIDTTTLTQSEPLIQAKSALYFPESGIVDSHTYMAAHEQQFLSKGGLVAYEHKLIHTEKVSDHWESQLLCGQEKLSVHSQFVVNAAGLGAAEISCQALQSNRFAHKFCRGRYFSLSPKFQSKFSHLIYPAPPKDGLGIHVTVDLDGFARLGPDVEWSELTNYRNVEKLYDCDWDSLVPSFTQTVQRYCPSVNQTDLSPGLIGVRAKLFLDQSAHRDFLVENHNGFIHCLGIESPGLTASLAIADEVANCLSDAAT